MKNILIIATCFPPMGGIGTVRVTKYVKYLEKFGWKPTVVTIDDKFISNWDDTLLKDINKDVEIIKLNFNCKKNETIGQGFYKQLKKDISKIIKKKKYDALFITGGPFEALKIAPYVYRKFKIPNIIDLRDPWKLQRISSKTKLIRLKGIASKFLIGITEKRVFKNAFAICTVNDTMTKEYKREYPKLSNKFYTIANGYDKSDYEIIEPKVFNEFSIIYAGKFNVSAGFRNPTNLFKAIKILYEKGVRVKFFHIGKKEEIVIEIAKKEKVEEYCTFLGQKKYEETLAYCKGANILALIGGEEKSEQTGKIFDYIGCQRPILVLSTGESEIDVVCRKVKNAYRAEKDNIDSIVEKIIEMYNNKDNEIEKLEIQEYDREFLTLQLVEILERINKKGK